MMRALARALAAVSVQELMVRSVITRLILFLSSLSLCLLATELGLRMLAAAPSTVERDGAVKHRFAAFRPDPILSFALRPGWKGKHEREDFLVDVRINALGLRGAPAMATKSAGSYRILVLGDSFAFGFGVENDQTFPAVLERLLQRDDPKIEVLNAGVPGYSADHHLLFMQIRGFALDPDLVIVATCQNDISDLAWSRLTLGADLLPTRTLSRRRMIDYRGRMRYLNKSQLRVPALLESSPGWLTANSHTFNWVRFRALKLWLTWATAATERRMTAEAGPAPQEPIAELKPEQIERGLASGNEFRLRYHSFLMAGLEREARAHSVPLKELNIGPGAGPTQQDCIRSHRECLDLAELLPPEDFFPNDGHWTPRGHERIAAEVYRWLRGDPEVAIAEGSPGTRLRRARVR